MRVRLLIGVVILAAAAGILVGTVRGRPAPGGPTTAPVVAKPAGKILALVGSAAITEGDIETLLGNSTLRYRLDEYRHRRRALQETISNKLLENEAARRHMTVQALLQAEVEGKAKPVTDEEARAVFETASARFGTVPPSDALRSIAESMRRQRVSQRRTAFNKELEHVAGVRVFLEPPRISLTVSEGVSRGPAGAPITIVEFSDSGYPLH